MNGGIINGKHTEKNDFSLWILYILLHKISNKNLINSPKIKKIDFSGISCYNNYRGGVNENNW